ncbi:hypothetical protein AB0I28_25055 [Phytomonospora sp. NPDC050363]|uniref:hypothetical protein n=1 Tax=Phytomonospora sp. NPDC050363 TaxID=3155642 RepID=UPI0033D94204
MRASTLRRVIVGSAAALVAVTLTAGPAWAAPKEPPTPKFGPSIDDYAPDETPGKCLDKVEQPGVAAFRDFVLPLYPGTSNGGIHACSGFEHNEGRAWDWMVDADDAEDKAVAEVVLDWLLAEDRYGNDHAMARRLGIKYIIWNRRYLPLTEGADHDWVAYTADNPHTDHVHFSFSWAGARKQTTWWNARLEPDRLLRSHDHDADRPSVRTFSTGDDFWQVIAWRAPSGRTDPEGGGRTVTG